MNRKGETLTLTKARITIMRVALRTLTLSLCFISLIATGFACGGDTSSQVGSDENGESPSDEGSSDASSQPLDEGGDVVSEPGEELGEGDGESGNTEVKESQCTDEENDIILSISVESIMGDCIGECMMAGSTDLSGCVAICVEAATDLSLECSECFGVMSLCIMSTCIEWCPADLEQGNICAADNCGQALQTCIGVESAPSPTMNCMNAADQQKIEQGAVDAMETCLAGCVSADDPSDCFGTCASDQELSINCSGCFADLGTCALSSCGAVCTEEAFSEDACTSCMDSNCGPEFQGCTGFDLFAEEESSGEGGLCESDADQEALSTGDTLVSECAAECINADATCFSGCMANTEVSTSCIDCLAPLQACLQEKCGADCALGSDDPSCGGCMNEECMDEKMNCFSDECTLCPPSPGECMNSSDGPLLETEQEAIGSCTASCVDAADPLSCGEACLSEAGLSLPCSSCMAALSVCTVDKCGSSCNPQAQAQDGGAACQMCMDGECAAETQACFGESGGPGLPTDEIVPDCVNEGDSALLASESDPKGVCEAACLDADQSETCLSACLEQAGFSAECSSCVSELSACVTKRCGPVCNNPAMGEQCEGCVADLCATEQAACYQGDGPGFAGECSGSSDSGILESNPNLIQACMGNCMADPSSAGECLTACFADLGLSMSCSGCVSSMLGCTMEKCSDECSDPTNQGACSSCSETQCGEEMEACYGSGGANDNGSGPGGPPGGQLTGEGICMNPADGQVMESDPYMNSSCAQQCFTEADQAACVGSCLYGKGLSEGCAYCMGDLIACSTEFCLTECMGGGPSCQTCTDEACTEQSELCFAP